MIKDILKDIVAHTYPIGLDLVKITGDSTSTTIEGITDKKEVILQAVANSTIKEFEGTFGLPDLGKLDHHLKNKEYSDATITVIWEDRNGGENLPTIIRFENSDGDYKNDYKLMTTNLINEKIKGVKFKGAGWQVEFEPSVTSINRFKLQDAANSDETLFMVKTEGNLLKFYFGDANTHEGNFIFHTGVTGKLKQNWTYPIKCFLGVLNLDGDKTVKFSDDGVAVVTVDSGIANYTYFIPAQTK
jgi:hypothetical protein